MQLLSMDYMSLPAALGYKTVLVIIDYFTQYVWAYKFTTAGTGKTTIKALTDLFRVFGQPKVLMSNNGSHFANKEVNAFCADRAIVVAKTPPYLPHTNGAVEGANSLLINALKKELAAADLDKNPRNNQWPYALDSLVARLNSRVVGTTGHRPANLLFAYVQRNKDPRRKPLGSNKLADELGKALTAVFNRRLEAAAHVAFSQARHNMLESPAYQRELHAMAATQLVAQAGLLSNGMFCFKTKAGKDKATARAELRCELDELLKGLVAGIESARELFLAKRDKCAADIPLPTNLDEGNGDVSMALSAEAAATRQAQADVRYYNKAVEVLDAFLANFGIDSTVMLLTDSEALNDPFINGQIGNGPQAADLTQLRSAPLDTMGTAVANHLACWASMTPD
ncbi:hypothetical protein ACM66B_002170 [Microbotryomycetes sp. NB124-2]